jgi:hypothetical protein
MMSASTSSKNPPNKNEPQKFIGGTKIHKELQKTLFFAAYDTIVSSAESITEKRQKDLLCDLIIGKEGNTEYVTLTEQMVCGAHQFAHLYQYVERPVNDNKNLHSLSTVGTPSCETQLILKDCYFPQSSTGAKLSIYTSTEDAVDNAITQKLLRGKSIKSRVVVTPTTMIQAAKDVLKNGRKALACAVDAESEYRNGTLPSGRTLADYHK